MWRSLVHAEGYSINAGPRQRMLDHRNDYSLMALGGFLLLSSKAGVPWTEHYQLVRALSADAVVTVL